MITQFFFCKVFLFFCFNYYFDRDLSDHGAVPYVPKKEEWGTNDIDIIKEMDILMYSDYYDKVNEVVRNGNGQVIDVISSLNILSEKANSYLNEEGSERSR